MEKLSYIQIIELINHCRIGDKAKVYINNKQLDIQLIERLKNEGYVIDNHNNYTVITLGF